MGILMFWYIDFNVLMVKLYCVFSLKFFGSYVIFVNFSIDGSELLFGVSSDCMLGMYFLINIYMYKVQKLFDVVFWIDFKQMVECCLMIFMVCDGIKLEVILMFFKGVGENNLLMVLMLYGGFIGIEDIWFYDDDVQFFVSCGYLVLQINFWGFGGCGIDFE